MKVFLVPVGSTQHLPYCEPSDTHAPDAVVDETQGFFAGLKRRFRAVLTAAEQSRLRHDDPAPEHPGWMGRTKTWALRWIADRIAEQRLLWQLRGCHEATLIYPSDLSEREAMRLLLDELERDGDRHLRWLVVDAALLVLSGVLTLLPGPNLIAYYFAFRVVGHYLSRRGARQGRHRVVWSTETSPVLSDLRTALRLEPHVRHTRLRDIASRLELPHLATFVERVALKGA
jgi:hypothetical protein